MNQQPEMKQQGNIDMNRVYCTNGTVQKTGRAVAICLEDATLPGNKRDKTKHMTVLFRNHPKWTKDEINLFSIETTNWIKNRYGNQNAPIPFNIDTYGPRSCAIKGDLYDLCIYLRQKFSSMTKDNQRIPHVELFKRFSRRKHDNQNDNDNKYANGRGNGRGRGRGKRKMKMNENKNKYENYGKKNSKMNTYDKNDKNGKIKAKMERMISKINELENHKHNEILLLNQRKNELELVLTKADDLDSKTINEEIKQIGITFRQQKKAMKKSGRIKNNRHGRRMKQQMKRGNRNNKFDKKNEKKLGRRRKQLKLGQKEERKLIKSQNKQLLQAARIECLPQSNNNNTLNIYIDGYNIIGCDSICRKSMRGKRGSMKSARKRFTNLVENFFTSNNLNYKIKLHIYFDGNGKNEVVGGVSIVFSTKKQIVDDKLVEELSKNNKEENANNLVITSDREFTLRLSEIGVKVMTSKTFYKTYLVTNDKNDDNNDDEKQIHTNENENENDDDRMYQVITNKLNENFPAMEGNSDNDYDFDHENDHTEDENCGEYEQVEGWNDFETTQIDNEDSAFEEIFEEIFGEDYQVN